MKISTYVLKNGSVYGIGSATSGQPPSGAERERGVLQVPAPTAAPLQLPRDQEFRRRPLMWRTAPEISQICASEFSGGRPHRRVPPPPFLWGKSIWTYFSFQRDREQNEPNLIQIYSIKFYNATDICFLKKQTTLKGSLGKSFWTEITVKEKKKKTLSNFVFISFLNSWSTLWQNIFNVIKLKQFWKWPKIIFKFQHYYFYKNSFKANITKQRYWTNVIAWLTNN